MDNPMDINLNRDNNPMKSLTFIWIAIFKDGTKIEQYNEDKSENKFQLIKDKFTDLGYFNLTDRKGHFFTVDLINGLIGFNYATLPYVEVEVQEKKENIRLIYFRTHRIEIGEQDLKEKIHTIEYYLGFQYNDKNGNNRQLVLKIDEQGNFILGDK
jgi:hypothetical protein